MTNRTAVISGFICFSFLCIGVSSANAAISCSNDSLAKRFEQFAKSSAILDKIDGQFDKLCEYGKNTGAPMQERMIKEQLEIVKACPGQTIAQGAFLSNRTNFIDYKEGVESDCRKAAALSRSPQSASDFVARGRAYIEKKDYARAISDFSEAIKRDATLAVAFYNRGAALNAKGDAKAALADRLEAFRLDPKFGGSDDFVEGREEQKLSAILAEGDETVARPPEFSGGYVTRSNMHYMRGEYDQAISDATEAFRISSRDPAPMNNRAISYEKKGQIDEALDDMGEAILLNPNIAALYRNRGRIYLARGDLPNALNDLDQAIRLDAKQMPAFVYRGQLNEKMGKRDNAIADYKAALFLDESRFYTIGLDAYITAVQRLTALLDEDKGKK